ncbi:MAG: hypothetical protein KJ666_17420 [Bacteroidetes bacterium]|nr:hypothetical protein [Bacteroidota bacterium]
MNSPFIYGKIASGEAFTDRKPEQKRLSDNIASGINSILISPRRWGKSSLVARVGQTLQRNTPGVRFCFLDLFNVRNEQEFYSHLTKEVMRVSFPKWKERIESAKHFFKQITPKFSVGIDPGSDFSVSLNWEEVRKSPEEVLNLPEIVSKERKIRLVVCLDEFQNIGFFDNPLTFQKKLRAHWQHHKLATYCLYGSKRHMMTELFENKSMPLYKFGDVLFLEKIPETYWVSFIKSGFKRTGKSISENLALQIARQMENHPYFVQQLAHTVWSATKKTCTEQEYRFSIETLLTQYAILFQREVDGLTNLQINFLKALCSNVTQFSAAETLHAYRLGTSGNVNRIKESLVNKEIIDITPQHIEFIDPLFKLWFSTVYMKQ